MQRQNLGWHVTLYRQNAEEEWENIGIGWIQIVYPRSTSGLPMSTGIPMLRVRAETILLRVRVILFPVNVYERDGNNFIIWREPSNDINNNNNNERDEDNDMLFSLSFQNPAGRDDIWQNIIQIQARARIAAINIQAYVRTLIQRHRYVHVRNSTIIIQAYVRRLNLAMRNSSATIIQSNVRMIIQRQRYLADQHHRLML